MRTVRKSIRLPEKTVKEIEALASESGKEFSAVANDLMIEAVKMRHCPGILFAAGPTGRRARIAGSGIDVWELMATFRQVDENYDKLKKTYHWLSDLQIRSALSFYRLYPDEIDERIARSETKTPDRVFERYPFLAKPAGKK
jgi:uncharacterized protein (DUF433 family)